MNHSTVAILGGGPIGVEALLACTELGLNAILFERDEVGANVKKWGHVRLFSPFRMNCSDRGRKKLANKEVPLPSADKLLTGEEYVSQYLLPLSQLPDLNQAIQTHTTVEHIGKVDLLKSDLIGSSRRTDHCFRLMLNQKEIRTVTTADYVLDCTGTFGNHNWFGNGGIPAVGEREYAHRIHYGLPKIRGIDRQAYLGRKTVLIGSGYSAATNAVALADLCKEDPRTQIIWLTRHNREKPMEPIVDDALHERDRLTQAANQLALKDGSGVSWIRNALFESIEASDDSDSQLKVKIRSRSTDSTQAVCVDNIIANVGFRPDRSIYEELQVHECYATHGPMKLAATLMGETSTDCLTQSAHGIQSLKSPEPNFYLLGAKSYGRSSRFLIKIGLEQISDVVDEIVQRQTTE